MSSNALEAQGTELYIGDSASPVAYSLIPEAKNFSGPGGSASIIDVSDLSSTAKEKRMGLADEGQLQFTLNYIPKNAVHASLRTARANRALTPFKMVFTDASPSTTWTFDGYVTAFPVSGAVDGSLEGNVTIEISGSILES